MTTATTNIDSDWRAAGQYPADAERSEMAMDGSGRLHWIVPVECFILGIIAGVSGEPNYIVYQPREHGPAFVGAEIEFSPKGASKLN